MYNGKRIQKEKKGAMAKSGHLVYAVFSFLSEECPICGRVEIMPDYVDRSWAQT